VARLGVQVCAALAAAHAAGLVHRDVKPQNLILGRDGVLRLGDFGIAVGHGGTQLTLAGTVLGTAGYLAPEQARGEQVTAAADIYAVGAVLYELLTGEPAKSVESLSELGAADGFRPPDVASRLPGAPAELVAAVTACLSVKPEDRPASAAALARLLAPVASEADTLSMPADPARRATEILAPRDTRLSRRWATRRFTAVAALVAAAAGGVAAAVALSSGGHASRAPSTPHAVAPAATGANVVDQAQNLASWFHQHSG
jgi:serine/threonine protein kinase